MSEKRRDLDFLDDIKEAIERVDAYIKGFTFDEFLKDRKTQDAVIRNFEIMGEAAKKISSPFKSKFPEIPWKKIAGLRDKFIHFYFGIDYGIVWNISRKELPALLKQIKAIGHEH